MNEPHSALGNGGGNGASRDSWNLEPGGNGRSAPPARAELYTPDARIPARVGDGTAAPPAGSQAQEPLTALLKEVFEEAGQLVRSEAEVIKLEARESIQAVVRDLIKVAAFGAVALLGGICLLVFAILAVGDLVGNWVGDASNGYWLSALFFGLLFTLGGGGLAYRYSKAIGKDGKLDATKAELERNREFIEAERQAFTKAVTP